METQLLFEISAELAPPIAIGGTPAGDRIIFYVTGGKFEGPRLRGEVMPGGGDWFLVRPDNVGVLDVRIVLKTDDGEPIYMVYRGVAKLPPGGLGAPGPMTIRTAPTFEVSSKGKYAWLNALQAVAEGEPMTGAGGRALPRVRSALSCAPRLVRKTKHHGL